MTRKEAIERLENLLGKCWTGAAVVSGEDFKAVDMAISALREQESPCAACGYGGRHMDAPPCSTICPAHPKLESSRTESDTVKGVDFDQFNWISVEERLPEEHPSIFAKFFGTDRWSGGMFRVCSDTVIVAYKDGTGNSRTTVAYTVDGAWSFTVGLITGEVTHWMPLPEPPEEEAP